MNNQVGLPLLSRMISQVEHSDKGTYGPFVSHTHLRKVLCSSK